MYRLNLNAFLEKSYKMEDDLAYTEDGILVYNIIVRQLPLNATVQNVSKYFSKSGEIKNIRLERKNKQKQGFVCFAEPKAAAKVLQKKNHMFNRTTIRVEASPTWYQPDGKRIIAQLTKRFADTNANATDDSIACLGSSPAVEDNFPLIFTLNDDCLENICKLLPLDDQFNFALTCQRFYEIFHLLPKPNFAHISTKQIADWTAWQIRIRLQMMGPQIKHLDIDTLKDNNSTCVKFLSRFCTNTEKLTVTAYSLLQNEIRTLINRMHLLKELELIEGGINDSFIHSLKNLKNLKTLIIPQNYDITGKNLQLLSGLEKLSINGCISLQSRYFRKMCQNLKSLRYLDVRQCDVLKANDVEQMLEHLQELETLKFSTTEGNFNGIAKLPKLKSLEINDHCKLSVTEEFLKILVEHQAEQLEELRLIGMKNMNMQKASLVAKLTKLKILHFITDATDDEILKKFTKLSDLEEVNFNGCDVSDDGVLNLLKSCLKLKRLSLIQCDDVSPIFLHYAAKLLQDQRSRWQRTDQVHVILSDETDEFTDVVKELSLNDSEVLKVTIDQLYDNFLLHMGDYDDDDDDSDDFNHPYFDYDGFSDDDDQYFEYNYNEDFDIGDILFYNVFHD